MVVNLAIVKQRSDDVLSTAGVLVEGVVASPSHLGDVCVKTWNKNMAYFVVQKNFGERSQIRVLSQHPTLRRASAEVKLLTECMQSTSAPPLYVANAAGRPVAGGIDGSEWRRTVRLLTRCLYAAFGDGEERARVAHHASRGPARLSILRGATAPAVCAALPLLQQVAPVPGQGVPALRGHRRPATDRAGYWSDQLRRGRSLCPQNAAEQGRSLRPPYRPRWSQGPTNTILTVLEG